MQTYDIERGINKIANREEGVFGNKDGRYNP
jgi:hypothetical protein